jgi:hypothetical protein
MKINSERIQLEPSTTSIIPITQASPIPISLFYSILLCYLLTSSNNYRFIDNIWSLVFIINRSN